MDELAQLVRSPLFWFGTVICGLVLNVCANYAQRVLDKATGAIGRRWREATLRRRMEVAEKVNAILEEPAMHEAVRFMEMRLHLLALYLMCLTVLSAVFGYMWAAALLIFLTAIVMLTAMNHTEQLLSAVQVRPRSAIEKRINKTDSTAG